MIRSRKEINKILNKPTQRIISQLLEENRILRERLGDLKLEIENFDWGCESCGESFEHNEESLCSFIDKTLTAADLVGKETNG